MFHISHTAADGYRGYLPVSQSTSKCGHTVFCVGYYAMRLHSYVSALPRANRVSDEQSQVIDFTKVFASSLAVSKITPCSAIHSSLCTMMYPQQ